MYIVKFKTSINHFDKALINFFILENSKNFQIIEIQGNSVIFQAEFMNFYQENLINNFKKIFPDKNLEVISQSKIDYQEWRKTRLKSLEVGKFKFKPIFEKTSQDNDYIYLDILVGAFGVEGHPTTVLCLEIIEEHMKEFKNFQVAVDFGTGNGILSLALWKINIPTVLAIEILFSYCLEAQKNFNINNANNIKIINSSSMEIVKKVDLLVANIPLSTFKEKSTKILQSNFKFAIFSGIKKEKEKEFLELIKSHRIGIREKREKENWLGFLCNKDKVIKEEYKVME